MNPKVNGNRPNTAFPASYGPSPPDLTITLIRVLNSDTPISQAIRHIAAFGARPLIASGAQEHAEPMKTGICGVRCGARRIHWDPIYNAVIEIRERNTAGFARPLPPGDKAIQDSARPGVLSIYF